MDYQTYIFLQAKGARWGDLECLDEEDILADLVKRRDEIELLKAQRIVIRALLFERREAERKVAREKQLAREHFEKTRPPTKQIRHFKRDFSEKPKPKRNCCVGCKKFTAHSNPPQHFTEEVKFLYSNVLDSF